MRQVFVAGIGILGYALTAAEVHVAAWAQAIQTGSIAVRLETVATGLGTGGSAPNFGAHTGDPRFLYVGQQDGIVRILDFNQPTPLLATNFLNIPSALGPGVFATSFEKGLIGGAFHPDFNVPGAPGYRKFYTHTSETIGSGTPDFFHQSETGFTYDHQGVIREWTVREPNASGVMTVDTSIPSRVLMRLAQPQNNHNGGALAFGPDKYLYIALGDGGGGNDRNPDNSTGTNSNTDGHTNRNNPDGAEGIGFLGHGNAQDRRNVYGKILRIKPTIEGDAAGAPTTFLSTNGQYRIPDDNPFTIASNPPEEPDEQIPGWQASWVDEIYAFGLRNPFRMSFDRETGKLYLGDVGQGTREEVNLIEKGGNYGWVAREGRIQNPSFPLATNPTYVAAQGTSFTDPIADYFNSAVGNGGISVIGGFVYRGLTIGLLDGKYVFGDWDRSNVAGGGMMYMDIAEPGPNQVYDLTISGPVSKPGFNLYGIAEDANGEIYYLFSGQIVKLLPVLTGVPGDYNNDTVVDVRDYRLWKVKYGTTGPTADGNGDGIVDAGDYVYWRNRLDDPIGAGGLAGVPEPAACLSLAPAVAIGLLLWRRRERM